MTATAPAFHVIGHQAHWVALARAFARDKSPQTLLLSGPMYIGKSLLAKRYAQLLLCADVTTDAAGLPAPCGSCRICHQVEIESYPDYRVYRPIVAGSSDSREWVTAPEALETSGVFIDMARGFSEEAMRKPVGGPRKVMQINGIDRTQGPAANSLLKTFEEPGRGISIVLLAENAERLLPTVRSRCWHLPLSLVADTEIDSWLQRIAPTATPHQRAFALEAAEGRPGIAHREIERLVADDTHVPRSRAAREVVKHILEWQPVGALALTEEAQRLSKIWWIEDSEGIELKKADSRIARSSAVRFLDELARAYRTYWKGDLASQDGIGLDRGLAWAAGLDQIRKTRHYILGNVNTSLALDVMFGRLIALHRSPVAAPEGG